MTQAQLFHDFMVKEVWADNCTPSQDGGVTLYMSEHYDEFHNAYNTALYCGAFVARDEVSGDLDGPATIFQFPDQSTITVADNGSAMLPNTGGAERVLIITNEAHNAILANQDNTREWHETGFQTPGDQWLVPVTNEVMNCIYELRMEGETLSDVLIRMAAFTATGRRTQA